MILRLISLTLVTASLAAISIAGPWRERQWGQVVLVLAILAVGFVPAWFLVQGIELPSPLRMVEYLTHWVLATIGVERPP